LITVRHILITDTLIGLISPAMYLWLGPKLDGRALMVNIAGGQVYAHCIGTLAHVSMMWAYPRVVRWSRAQRWITVFTIFVAVTAIGCAIANVIFVLAGLYQARDFWEHFQWAFRIGLIITIVFGVSGAIIETLKSKLESANTNHERALKLATEARLSSLESRVHPHFLFNALNSISSLIREDPDRAERLIERMAALLRFSLDSNQLGVVTLSQEMEVVRGYLEIEKARFGDRLQFSVEYPPEMSETAVPPLSVQTLVENSVKYAVAPKREGGSICVFASGSSDRLEIEIRDDGSGVNLATIPAGHGLDLLQSRLHTIYDGAARLRAEGSSVFISLPCSAPISSTTKS
jgi:sensor histidine kinase YesM